MIQDTTDDPNKNIHFMENYYGTQEQWLFPGLMSIRSISIKASKYQRHSSDPLQVLTNSLVALTWELRIQSPADTRRISYQANNIDKTLVNCKRSSIAHTCLTLYPLLC